MDFLSNIQLKQTTLTKNERKACDRILEDLSRVQMCSLTELSEQIDITKTTILRFCQKLGYSGYPEFKYALISYVNTSDHKEEESKITYVEDVYADTARLIHHSLNEEQIRRIVKKIRSAEKIYAAGQVNSSVSALQMRYSLLMFGIDAGMIISSVDAKAIDLCAGNKDLILLYTASAKSELVKAVMDLKENCGCQIIMITMNGNHSYTDSADETVVLPSLSVPKKSLLENVPIFSVFNEILIYYLND